MHFLKIIFVLPLFMGLDAESASGDFYESGEGEQETAAPNTAAINCPSGFPYTVDGFPKCYAVLQEKLDWDSAQLRCGQLHKGAHLAIITNLLENQVVTEILLTHNREHIWIGGKRDRDGHCRSAYEWVIPGGAKLKMDFSSWYPGDPNCGGEKCLMMIDHTKQWIDSICENKRWSLCEVPKFV